jgi:hypothetical protein
MNVPISLSANPMRFAQRAPPREPRRPGPRDAAAPTVARAETAGPFASPRTCGRGKPRPPSTLIVDPKRQPNEVRAKSAAAMGRWPSPRGPAVATTVLRHGFQEATQGRVARPAGTRRRHDRQSSGYCGQATGAPGGVSARKLRAPGGRTAAMARRPGSRGRVSAQAAGSRRAHRRDGATARPAGTRCRGSGLGSNPCHGFSIPPPPDTKNARRERACYSFGGEAGIGAPFGRC